MLNFAKFKSQISRFTLRGVGMLELLIVVALIVVLAVYFLGGFNGKNGSVSTVEQGRGAIQESKDLQKSLDAQTLEQQKLMENVK